MSDKNIWSTSGVANSDLCDVNGASSKAGYLAVIVGPDTGSSDAGGDAKSGLPLLDVSGDADDYIVGIFTEVNLTGRTVGVRVLGEAYGVISASVTAGEALKNDGNGKLTPASPGDLCVGIAMESVTLPATPTGLETVNVMLVGPFTAPAA